MRHRSLLTVLALAALAAGCGRSRPTSRAAAAASDPAGYLGPAIAIADPPRGAMLALGGADPLPVPFSGQACDPVHPLEDLAVDGQGVPVSPGAACTPFSGQVQSPVGLSILHAEATNDVWELGNLAQSFLRSPSWFAAAPGDPASMAASGVALQLAPSFLDDRDRSTLNDVASLVEHELGKLDLDAVVGPVRFAQPDADGDGHLDTTTYHCVLYTVTNKKTGFEAWKTGPLTHGPVTVDGLRLAAGGVEIQVTVAGPRVPLSVTGNFDSGCLGAAQDTASGAASAAALVLRGQAALGLDAAGNPTATFPTFTATLLALSIDIDLGIFSSLSGAIGDAIAAEVQGPVQDAIRDAVQGELAARLAAFLAALPGLRTSIVLPPELGGAELLVEATLDALDFDPQRALVGLAVHVYPAAPVPAHAAAATHGAMELGGAIPDASGLLASSLAVGVKDDLLNQVLHAAWLAGAFDRDSSGLLGGALPGARLALFANLPPVLMPKPGGAPGVDLGWGDVGFLLQIPGPAGTAEARGFFSVILPVDRLEAGPAGIRISFAPSAPEAWAEVTDVNWGPAAVARESTAAILEGAIRNLLPQALAGSLASVPLPTLDLRAIDPGLPALHLSLGSPHLDRLGRYEFLSGSVTAGP